MPYTIYMEEHPYRGRFYRAWQRPPDLHSFHVQVDETDLQIYAQNDVRAEAQELVRRYRRQIVETIEHHPGFETALKPMSVASPYPIVADLLEKSMLAGVGPMAGVAGAIAEYVGRDLLPLSGELIVENGGDLFMRSSADRVLLVYAGESSPFRDRIRLKLRGSGDCRGVCTSSGSIGHSLSFGSTDASVIIASSAVTADVFATAVGNMVHEPADLEKALGFLEKQEGIQGALVLLKDRMAVWGDVELV
jgi:ApbE superfamily uncharacterized protein (UPF0280 family)